MPACLQKTLLLYAPVLLALAISAARSREHHAPSTAATGYSMDTIDETADELPHELNNDDDATYDQPQTAAYEGMMRHGKMRRTHKMLSGGGGGGYGRDRDRDRDREMDSAENDLALWINEEQVNMLSGMLTTTAAAAKTTTSFDQSNLTTVRQHFVRCAGLSLKIYAISAGRVSYYVKDPRINQHIPTIPSEVHSVNFTWRSGARKYYYHFDRLQSLDETILRPPTVSIKVQGKVPQVARRKHCNRLILPLVKSLSLLYVLEDTKLVLCVP